jgi:hypothetical protein
MYEPKFMGLPPYHEANYIKSLDRISNRPRNGQFGQGIVKGNNDFGGDYAR